jgi:adenylyltransferase/sulfurtransferase
MLALRDIEEKDVEHVLGSTVAMVGAGGIGSPTLRLLTSLGFGTIRIIDGDSVELHNLQRQNIYNTEDIGKPKASVAASNLSLLNPDIKFDAIEENLDSGNAMRLLEGVDVIIDGLDSFKARLSLNHASVNLRTPYVFAGAVEYFANLSTFIPGETGCFSCTLGNAKDNPKTTAEHIGVSPSLLSFISGIIAREALLIVIGRTPKLAGKVMAVDIHTLSFDIFDIAPNPVCPVCSKTL